MRATGKTARKGGAGFYRFRLVFLTLLFLGVTLALIVITPWRRWLGRPRNYAALVAQGQPIASAIERFHIDIGLWPEYLEDLVPAYLATSPRAAWYYVVTPEGPSLAISTGERHSHVGYDFDPIQPRWQVFGDVENRVLVGALSPAEHHGSHFSGEQMEPELRELDRRIAREPMVLEHRRGKASLLRSLGAVEKARSVIEAAARDLPQSFWPPLALAALEGTPGAREGFAAWVSAHPSFTHEYYLSILDRQSRGDASALRACEKSLDFPIEAGPDDPNILAFYFWDMTRYALAEKELPLVLRFAAEWQNAEAARELDEKSYLPLRAAALLRMRDARGARAQLAALGDKAITWAKNIPGLSAAVDCGDYEYKYDPGASPPPYVIFSLPK